MIACSCCALVLSSCDDSGRVIESRSGFTTREPIQLEMPERRVGKRDITPETYRFLEAIGKMEAQISDLEVDLDKAQELHESYDFDAFLNLDPWTVEKESLFYLSHFCDAGHFTVQRKVLLSLLEQRVIRKRNESLREASPDGRKDLEQRLAEAMLFREERIMDLEHVLHVYDTRQGAQEFIVPDYVSPEDLETLRANVAERLGQQRALVVELDQEIALLKQEFESL